MLLALVKWSAIEFNQWLVPKKIMPLVSISEKMTRYNKGGCWHVCDVEHGPSEDFLRFGNLGRYTRAGSRRARRLPESNVV